MGKFDGKTLLELGTSVASVDIVKYAKSEGAYVIVTDYLLSEKSEAKKYADETAMISTLDVDALTEFAREKRVDGVFCGVSEANLRSVFTVTERLGLPCYFTMEQWDVCQNKIKFRELCNKYGVPTPKTYNVSEVPTKEELSSIDYPVIIKPVDQGSGIGIHICSSESEFVDKYMDAYKRSLSHQVIVEQYLMGEEFSATYTICNGAVSVPLVSKKFMCKDVDEHIPIDQMLLYPSDYTEEYLEKVNDRFIEAVKSTGFKNGVFFVQGIRTEKGLYVFEMGLRLNGAAVYRIIDHVCGFSRIEGMVNYALTGSMDIDISANDLFLKGKKCCRFNILCRSGKIGRVEGIDDVQNIYGVISTYQSHKATDIIREDVPLAHIAVMIYIVRDSLEELKETVRNAYEAVKVWDEEGNDMKVALLKEIR